MAYDLSGTKRDIPPQADLMAIGRSEVSAWDLKQGLYKKRNRIVVRKLSMLNSRVRTSSDLL